MEGISEEPIEGAKDTSVGAIVGGLVVGAGVGTLVGGFVTTPRLVDSGADRVLGRLLASCPCKTATTTKAIHINKRIPAMTKAILRHRRLGLVVADGCLSSSSSSCRVEERADVGDAVLDVLSTSSLRRL